MPHANKPFSPFKRLIPPSLLEEGQLRATGTGKIIKQGLATGIFSGLVIGLFRIAYTFACDNAVVLCAAYRGSWAGVAYSTAMVFLFGIIAWACVRHEPLIAGSGIPHVELVVQGKLPMPWRRILWTKFVGTLASLASGLAVGREGPCIQMGAAVGCGVGYLWREGLQLRFLVGGSTAGMTAAFGAPLAGMLFAFEEMRTLLTLPMLLFTSCAAFGAWFVVDHILQLGLVFSLSHATLSLSMLWTVPLAGVLTGLLGVVYNACLMGIVRSEDKGSPKLHLRMLPAFVLAAVAVQFYPRMIPALGPAVEDLALGGMALVPLLFLWAVRIVYNCLSFASGVSGGILMPMLFAGALTGALLHELLSFFVACPDLAPAIIILCTAGLFASTVRAPLTGAFLVTEMTGAWVLLPALVVAAWISSSVATLCKSVPVYDSLRARQLENYLRAHGGLPTKKPEQE